MATLGNLNLTNANIDISENEIITDFNCVNECDSDYTSLMICGSELTVKGLVADISDFVDALKCDECETPHIIGKDATTAVLIKYGLTEDEYISILNSIQSKLENFLI